MERTYPPGVSCWIDTAQPDPQAASRFYGGLFGWTFENVSPPGDPDIYLMGRLDGRDVAAVSRGDGPAEWTTYFSTDDIDSAVARVVAAGGTSLGPPLAAGDSGTSASCADPQGARFELWQAGTFSGAQAVNGPASWNFSDLRTPDPAAGKAFYTSVFGWDYLDLGPTVEAMISVAGYGAHLAATADPDIYERQALAPDGFENVIGAVEPTAGDERPRWRVKFSVANRSASMELAESLGATVLGTDDQVWALLADIRDPQGAEFTISEFVEPE